MAIGAVAASTPCSVAQWSTTYAIQRLGLFGPDQTGSNGVQTSYFSIWDIPNVVAGTSTRYSTAGLVNGEDAWVWDGVATHRVGLIGGAYTGSDGLQYSMPLYLNRVGLAAGYSDREVGEGEDSWVWDGAQTRQVGLTGGPYYSSGHQQSYVLGLNDAGYVVGTSDRYTAGGVEDGRVTWVWDGTSTRQIGLTGPDYTSSSGATDGGIDGLSTSGQVTGHSYRFSGNTHNGEDVWVWNGGATQQIGLIGGVHTGSAGYQFGIFGAVNAAGQVCGLADRITGVSAYNGTDAWVWNGRTTLQIGLIGGANTGSAGYQRSSISFQNGAGQEAGHSDRLSGVNTANGQDAWVWDGTMTRQVGLVGGVYRSSSGYQYSDVVLQSEAGQVAGYSSRDPGPGTSNGRDTWAWNGTTQQIGLIGGPYAGSAGFQYSTVSIQNDAGQVTGYSRRIVGVSTDNGSDAWVWNGSTTLEIGSGFRSMPTMQNDAGQVVGLSSPINDAGVNLGQDVWLWNGTTTLPIGLTGGPYTVDTGPSAGYEFSEVLFQSPSGHVSGYSRRYTNGRNQNGQTAWYYDPSTAGLTAIVGSTRTSDGYAYSGPGALTDDGILVGGYTYFENGEGPGEPHGFAFRPDLGFIELGSLVAGGLDAHGWSTINQVRSVVGSSPLHALFGGGLVAGQTSGESLFVMMPQSFCVADFDHDGVVGSVADIEAFFACLAGNCCAACGSADFDGDGETGTDADIETFFRVLAGGSC
jgi:hypothetical protein